MLNGAYSFAIGFLITVVMKDVGGCSVDRVDKAAAVGDDISITCSAGDGLKVFEWRLEGEIAFLIFRTTHFDYDTKTWIDAYLKDGYFVDNISNPILKESHLTIKNINHSNAGVYSCVCADTNSVTPKASATSNIVIVSTPKFSTTTDLRDGQQISFICNVSFGGIANSSIAIEDFMGRDYTAVAYATNSRRLHNFTLTYDVTADSSIDQIYWCNVILTNDSSNTQIYSTKLEASVQWTPVQNVKINSNARCMNGSQCAINEVLICSADGNPKSVTFNWTISLNGSEPTEANIHGDQLVLTSTGQYTIQCTAVNFIKGFRYQNASDKFTTQEPSEGSHTALIIGLVVGLGGSMIIVAIIALEVVFCIRKKRQQNKAEVYTTLDVQRSATSGTSQQDIYTELETPSADHKLQIGHLVAAENYETVIPAGL